MTVSASLDSAGRRRSPSTLPGYHAGRPPRNKCMLNPADPPTVEEIVCVMRHARRLRLGAAALARSAPGDAGRPAALCHRWPHPRTALVGCCGPWRVSPPRRRSGRQAALRAAPARSCTRRGARPRGHLAERHPAPARTCQPRHDQHLPAGHRHRSRERQRRALAKKLTPPISRRARLLRRAPRPGKSSARGHRR